MRGTKEGNQQSFKYNEELRFNTLRFAMIEQIRAPPRGFEREVRAHFFLQRRRIAQIAQQWLAEASDAYRRKMGRVVAELVKELARLECDEAARRTQSENNNNNNTNEERYDVGLQSTAEMEF